MTEKKFPAVSIIVPMYNVEKFIGETLDSILAQTFTDYELLVVDDCSTDKSCEIVESYIPKFDGRLRFIKSEVQSGGRPGIPRNIAINLARGEYIMFVDSDDVITPTALEEVYPVAKKFDADVLLCQKRYITHDESVPIDKKYLEEVSEGWTEFVEEPVLIENNIVEIIEAYGFYKIAPTQCNRLFRRDLIIKNNVKFPKFKTGEDIIFQFFVFCYAKNIVVAPNVFYVYRQRNGSLCHTEPSPEKFLNYWTDNFLQGIPLMDRFMDNFELFREHPEYKYLSFELLAHYGLWHVFSLYKDIPAVKMGGFIPSAKADKFIRDELRKIEDPVPLMAVMFSRMNFFQVHWAKFRDQIKEKQEQIEQLQAQIELLQKQIQEL